MPAETRPEVKPKVRPAPQVSPQPQVSPFPPEKLCPEQTRRITR